MKVRLRRWQLFATGVCALLLVGESIRFLHAQTTSAKPALETAPETVVADFYKWYLSQLVQNKDPLHDYAYTTEKYVSSGLRKEIEKKIHSADGIEADYFMKAQHYLDDWPNNVGVSSQTVKGSVANVVIMLGASKIKPYRLEVLLIKENGVWKIRRVTKP